LALAEEESLARNAQYYRQKLCLRFIRIWFLQVGYGVTSSVNRIKKPYLYDLLLRIIMMIHHTSHINN